MPIHPRSLPRLAQELSAFDWIDVQDAFLSSVNVQPQGVHAQNANVEEACYALLFYAYSHDALDVFVTSLRQLSADLDKRIRDIIVPAGPCPTSAISIRGMPIIDRRTLRDTLPELIDNASILTIEGPPAAGKSYSAHLIDHVGSRLAAADVAVFRIGQLVENKLASRHGATELEPYELMELIADQLGLQVRRELRTARAQDARIVQKLLSWFVARFPDRRNPRTPFWLVIDDLNSAACPPWIHDFAISLAEECAKDSLRDLRLVLIGFRRDRLVEAGYFLSVEDVHDPLTPEDVWNFIVHAAADSGKPVDPGDRDEALRGVWGDHRVPLQHEQAREIARRAAAMVRSL